ncbi:MAG: alpha-glucan family phosphorylase [Candidatus Pacebacteria bacterium]|nr:alpha-glucan family phosphorylase [Candidatus Paceibacterota bacterium]
MKKTKDNFLDVAYFSMEVAINSDMSTYSGGLGVLAGDTLKTFADFKYSAIGITLLHEQGYVEQSLDSKGQQVSKSELWNKEEYLTKLSFTIEVPLGDHSVVCTVWKYEIVGQFGDVVPVYFLDSNLPQNTDYDRTFTSYLYGGDKFYRLCQEQLLGLGGLILLEKLKYNSEKVRIYHLNEGHASFVGLALYEQAKKLFSTNNEVMKYIGSKLVFTTHTPVEAGHDRFSIDYVKKVLPANLFVEIPKECFLKEKLCMTRLSLYFSGIVTGVAKMHEKVTEKMFPEYDIIPVTNGAYHLEWIHPNLKKVYDEYIPEWSIDPSSLRKVISIPDNKIWDAHFDVKKKLIEYVNEFSENKFSADVCTLGYARRFTSYKRPALILADLERLESMIASVGSLQIIFAGKAHPCDERGKKSIKSIFEKIQKHKGKITMVFLEDYNMDMAKKLVAGVDIWLNTPLQRYEASGTSGMKAAFNGVPHLSVLDGWWPEGWTEDVTGWSIGTNSSEARIDNHDSWNLEVDDLYNKLATKILPLYYQDRSGFIRIMKHACALNGSHFNTYRMMNEYVAKVYFPLKNGLNKKW